MADLIFPPSLAPLIKRVTWTLERNEAAFTSPLANTVQRVTRHGARWRASIEMTPLDQDESAVLAAWLDQVSRVDHVGLVPVVHNRMTGSEGAGMPSLTSDFSSGTEIAGWAAGYKQGLLRNPYPQSGELVVYSGGTTSNFATRPLSVATGLPYLVTFDVPPQATVGAVAVFGASLTPTYFANNALPVAGRIMVPVTPVNGQIVPVLYPGNGSQQYAQSRFSRVSVNRCFLVEGAQPAGSNTIVVYCGLSESPQAALRVGQFVNVQAAGGWQLVRLRHDVDLIGGVNYGTEPVTHLGRAMFEPALRSAVANNASIQHVDPVCRMRLATPNSSATTDAPMFGGFAFDMIEDLP